MPIIRRVKRLATPRADDSSSPRRSCNKAFEMIIDMHFSVETLVIISLVLVLAMGWTEVRDWALAPCYWAVGTVKRAIAKEFTRESIEIQKSLATKVASHVKTDVYIFDDTGYFVNASIEMLNTVRHLKKDGRFTVLSATAQKVMKNNNEYLQFNTNKDEILVDTNSAVCCLVQLWNIDCSSSMMNFALCTMLISCVTQLMNLKTSSEILIPGNKVTKLLSHLPTLCRLVSKTLTLRRYLVT